MDEQNMVDPHNGIYATLKRNEILTHAAILMHLKASYYVKDATFKRPHIT